MWVGVRCIILQTRVSTTPRFLLWFPSLHTAFFLLLLSPFVSTRALVSEAWAIPNSVDSLPSFWDARLPLIGVLFTPQWLTRVLFESPFCSITPFNALQSRFAVRLRSVSTRSCRFGSTVSIHSSCVDARGPTPISYCSAPFIFFLLLLLLLHVIFGSFIVFSSVFRRRSFLHSAFHNYPSALAGPLFRVRSVSAIVQRYSFHQSFI